MRFSILALALVTVAACATEPDTTASPADRDALASFEQLGHGAAQRSYATLAAPAKARLWRAHLGRELPELKMTPAQQAIVAEVQARLPELVAHFDAALAARAEAAFTPDQLGMLFELPGRWQADKLAPPADSDCDTKWCTTCLPPQPEGTHCGAEGCTTTSDGCGWFGQQGCTRTCHMDDIEAALD